MKLDDMLHWWNLVYVLPLFTSVVWLLATVVSGMDGNSDHDAGDGGADADHDADLSHDTDTDMAHSADAHADHHAHIPHTHLDQEETMLAKALGILGLGKAPITLLAGMFFLSWGAFGMLSNRIFASILVYPVIYIWPSLATTFVVSFAITRTLAGVTTRYMPTTETFGVTRMELVGRLGRAVYRITDASGTVDISDDCGTIHRSQAKIDPGDQEIEAGNSVIVVDFDDSDKRFVVRKSTIS